MRRDVRDVSTVVARALRMTKLSTLLVLVTPAVVSACGGEEGSLGTSDDELRTCAGGVTQKGIDVSHHNDSIDWARVKASGVTFAFMRVSDGMHLDTQFRRNWAEAKRVGILRGAYQFFRPGQDPNATARLFLRKIAEAGGMNAGDLPAVLDVEDDDGVSRSTVRKNAQTWLGVVERETRIKPIVYTGANMSGVVGSSLSAHVLWVPNYGARCPLMPDGWSRWAFWQYSESGRVPGVRTAAYLDVFNGTMADLRALTLGGRGLSDAGAAPSPAPPTSPAVADPAPVVHAPADQDDDDDDG